MTIKTAARIGVIAAAAAGIALATVGSPASADEAPAAADVVGVGSDIVQNSLNFLADGDTLGHDGYNTAGNLHRLISFDATADANGRNAFSDPALGTSSALNPTVTLQAGTSPVQRPNGGNAGVNALVNDGKNKTSAGLIDFARSPNLPTAAQETAAENNLGSQLHTIEFAEDKQVIATAKTTNAPATLSVSDVLGIYTGQYTHWNDIPGNSTGSTDTIIPEIPQAGAGVRTVFLNALAAANGGTTPTLVGVKSVQQNDPTTITGLGDQAKNAIVPFPVARYNLFNSGYFKDPSAPYSQVAPPAALSASGISLVQNSSSFSATLPYYVIFREKDYGSTTPWQPGSTRNWVQELFYDPTGDTPPWVDSPEAHALITAAGLTVKYDDLGNSTKN